MATPFFGKRENETPTGLRPSANNGNGGYGSNTSSSTQPSSLQSASSSSAANRPVSDSAGVSSPAGKEGGSKLTVGPNIKLKGVEITDCDTLVVEGLVEATMDSHVIQIAEQGAFKGSAEIDVAEIHGEFHGNLTVRDRLTIYATGKVTGVIRYGKLVVAEGGQLSGEIVFGTQSSSKSTATSTTKPGLQAV